ALRAAAAASIQRRVLVLQILAGVVLYAQIARVHVDDPRQRVHVLEDRTLGRAAQLAADVAVGKPGDRRRRSSLGDLADGEVELVAAHEVERGRRRQRG